METIIEIRINKKGEERYTQSQNLNLELNNSNIDIAIKFLETLKVI